MSRLEEQIDERCRHLRLRSMAAELDSIHESEPKQFLLRFLQMQTENRDRTRIDRAVKSAGFYTLKSLADFRYDEVKLPAAVTPEELQALRFIKEKQNLIFYGNVGTGNYVKRLLMQSSTAKAF